jgi:MFS transporter (putative signal transducer)
MNGTPPARSNLLESDFGRAALFTLLYVSEGGPIGFIWWALPALLRTRGLGVDRITSLTAILVLPWVFKFLWAPLVDSLRTRTWGFRAWIVSTQLLMGFTLIPLIFVDPATDFSLWRGLLMLHAFAAATQDVSVDALAINAVPAESRGAINGYMQAGMLLGRSAFGGGALLLAAVLGWHWIFIGLIACVWSSLVLLLFVREPEAVSGSRAGFSQFKVHLGRAFRKGSTWAGLVFALTSGCAFEATGALAGPYLIDRGVSSETVGFFFAVPVVAATMIGGLAGGKLSDRIGRTRSAGWFLIGFVTMVLALAGADNYLAPPSIVLISILTVMYLFIGLFIAASYSLFMDLTDRRIGGTQFSTFMAATNGCESWSGWVGGQISARAGYAMSFFAMSLVSLVSLASLRFVDAQGPEHESRTELETGVASV